MLVEAEQLFRELGREDRLANCLLTLGTVQRELGQHDTGYATLERALHVFETFGDDYARAATLLNLGTIDDDEGRSAEALARFEHALELFRVAAMPQEAAMVLSNIASVHTALGDYQRTMAALTEAITVASTVDSTGPWLAIGGQLLVLAGERGEVETAAEIGACLDVHRARLGIPAGSAEATSHREVTERAESALGSSSYRAARDIGASFELVDACRRAFRSLGNDS
jgi:tetratricopeptide (TPR) repeat protein